MLEIELLDITAPELLQLSKILLATLLVLYALLILLNTTINLEDYGINPVMTATIFNCLILILLCIVVLDVENKFTNLDTTMQKLSSPRT